MRDEAAPHAAGFDRLVERRAAHEPVAHLVGVQEFFGLEFAVTPDTLIPRGDSETIVQAALDCAAQDARVLDMGTGSGALLLAFLHERPGARGVGIDASAAALAVAPAAVEAVPELPPAGVCGGGRRASRLPDARRGMSTRRAPSKRFARS